MAVVGKSALIAPTEYLLREKTALFKSEFADGVVWAMAGARPNHNRVAGSAFTALDTRLGTGRCEPFGSDQRVRLGDGAAYFYPDVSVACDARFDGDDCLLNPLVVLEVLSDSTEAIDRGRKWRHYASAPSLRAYVLLSQDAHRAEIYHRTDATQAWVYESVEGSEASLPLACLGIALPLAEVYRRVEGPGEDAGG